MQYNLIPTDVNVLTHYAAEKSFVAELNSMACRGLQRIYDDACDLGVALINPKTGEVTTWTVVYEMCNNEGEMTTYILHPSFKCVYRNPKLRGYTLTLFND